MTGPTVRGETDGDSAEVFVVEDGACIELKLFCDVMFLDLINGGFFIDDENAKPRLNVALRLKRTKFSFLRFCVSCHIKFSILRSY